MTEEKLSKDEAEIQVVRYLYRAKDYLDIATGLGADGEELSKISVLILNYLKKFRGY